MIFAKYMYLSNNLLFSENKMIQSDMEDMVMHQFIRGMNYEKLSFHVFNPVWNIS